MDEKDVLQMILSELKELKQGQQTMNGRLASVESQLTTLQSDIDVLKENSEITRSATNTLLEWAEEAQVQVRVPLFKKASEG